MIAPENKVEEIRSSQGRSYVKGDQDYVSSAPNAADPSVKQNGLADKAGREEVPEEELRQRVNQVNTQIANTNVTLKIRVDQETGKNLVTVVDRETGEVIREIPPEETVRLEARIEKMLGIFVDSTM